MNIARTTLSSKILQGKKDHFSKLCVDAVLKLHVSRPPKWPSPHDMLFFSDVQGRTDLQGIQIIKRLGNNMVDSYLEEGNRLVNPSSMVTVLFLR